MHAVSAGPILFNTSFVYCHKKYPLSTKIKIIAKRIEDMTKRLFISI